MSRQVLKWVSLTLLVLVFISCLVALKIHLSPWYLWSLAPAGESQVLVNVAGETKAIIDSQLAKTPLAAAQPLFRSTHRLVASWSDNTTTLILLPKHPLWPASRQALENQLQNQGWRTRQYGLLLIAYQGAGDYQPPSIVHTITNTILALRNETNPASPLLIATIAAKHNVISHEALKINAYRHPEHTEQSVIIISPSDSTLEKTRSTETEETPQIAHDQISLSVAGALLRSVPTDLKTSWDAKIIENFGFKKVKAAISSEIETAAKSMLYLTASEAGIATQEAPASLAAHLTHFLQQEEAYQRPVAQAFKLPDGTIGYERVPGQLKDVYETIADERGCHKPLEERTTLWFCQQDNRLALATSRELAVQLLETIRQDKWHVAIGASRLQALELPAPISIAVTGTDTTSKLYLIEQKDGH